MITSIITHAQLELHDAKITGIIQLGNKDVSVIKDLLTECVYKSSPHDKGDYILDENVQLEFENEEENPDVIKPGCANLKCLSQGCSDVFNPNLNSNIDYKSIQVRDKGFVGVNGSDKLLVFKDETALLNTVQELERLVEKHSEFFSRRYGNLTEDEMLEKVDAIGYDQDQQIHVFNNKLQFNSLFKNLAKLEKDFLKSGDDNWDNFPDHFFPGSAERSTLNTDVEMQVGNVIYKYNQDGSYFTITDGDLTTLEEIDNGTIDLNVRVNAIHHNPPVPLNGPPTCKTNESDSDYEKRNDGKYQIYWKIAIYNYPPYYDKISYSKTKSYKYKCNWLTGCGFVKSYPSSIRAGVESFSSCTGTGEKNTYGSNKHYVIAKQSAGWKSLSGQIIGIHQAHNITKNSVLTW